MAKISHDTLPPVEHRGGNHIDKIGEIRESLIASGAINQCMTDIEVDIHHDDSCNVFKGDKRGDCDCDPDVKFIRIIRQ